MAIKILILDDEREILNALKRLLKLDERFEPYVTTDPEKALNILKKENIQVVMSDIVMPEMNGIEFLEKAKEINGLVQVIMMSAYSTVERVLACLERGASDYIMKPFSDDEVRSVLDDIVRRLERWRRLVVLARGATLEARKQVGSEGPSTGLDATPQINEAATDSTSSPLNMVEERLIHLKEKYGNDHESLGVAIIKSIEQEENQLVREQLSMELGEVLREHPSEELLERVLISRDAYLRNMAIAIARELGEKMISTLEGLIESEDKDVRKLVLDIASKMPLEAVEGILLAGLEDEDPNIRATAAEYLGAQKSARAVKRLAEMVLEEEEPMVVATLLEVLAGMDECPQARKIIERFKKYGDPILLHSFLKFLGTFGEDSDYEWLLDGIEKGDIHFSREVIDCIQAMMQRMKGLELPESIQEMLEDEVGNAFNTLGAYQALLTLYLGNASRALELARRYLERPSSPAFSAAAQFLAEQGDDADRERLRKLVEEMEDEEMRSTICAALDSCCLDE